jgi:hypothetical protein
MTRRYIATVEYQDGKYWISFPGIEKAGSHAKRGEDIIPHARAFLTDWTRYSSPPPPSLDDAITTPTAPFDGTRLVIFEWEPPPRTGYRVLGYEDEVVVLEIQVPADKIERARMLALRGARPLSREEAEKLGGTVPAGLSYVLEADPDTAA